MGVDQKRLEAMSSIAGFLVPYWSSDEPEWEDQLHALWPKDAEKVMAGYACARCLADYDGMYRPVCPVCGAARDLEQDVVAFPDLWKDHLAARKEANENPVRTPIGTMEDFVRRVQSDPDVDHTTLKALVPSKFGRGRPK